MVRKADMVKHHRIRLRILGRARAVTNRGFGIQNLLHPTGAGERFGIGDHQVRHHDQRQQDLVDIVDKRDQLAGGHAAGVDLAAPDPDDQQNCRVHNELGHRVQQRRYLAHPNGRLFVFVHRFVKAGFLPPGAGKRADHPHAGQIFPQNQPQPVQLFLHRAVHGGGFAHHQHNGDHKQRDSAQNDERQLPVDGKRHHHAADAQKRCAHHQPDQHRDRILQLVDVTGDPVDQRGGAERIPLGMGHGGDFAEHRLTQTSAEALRGDRRDILAHQRAAQPQRDNTQHFQPHIPHHAAVARQHTLVNGFRHHQRQIQLQDRFQQFA